MKCTKLYFTYNIFRWGNTSEDNSTITLEECEKDGGIYLETTVPNDLEHLYDVDISGHYPTEDEWAKLIASTPRMADMSQYDLFNEYFKTLRNKMLYDNHTLQE